MAETLGLIGLDDATNRLLSRNEGLLQGMTQEALTSEHAALAWAQKDAAEGDILLVGSLVEAPAMLAERALSQPKSLQVIICAASERFEKLAAEVERSPLIDRKARCVSLGDAEGVIAALKEAIALARARRRHQATISASMARLGSSGPRPAKRAQYIEHLWMHIPIGVVVVSGGDCRIIDLNHQAVEVLYPGGDAELVGGSLGEYFAEDERARLTALLSEPELSPGAHAFALSGEGEPRYVDVTVAATHVEDTRLVLLEDITARMRTEEERARHFEVLEQKQAEIEALSTPIIQVWEDVLALPIVGAIDARRVSLMTGELLARVVSLKARYVILDLTGVQKMDAEIADSLLKMVGAADLLGTSCLLSGISPAVGRTMVELGVDLGSIRSFGDLHSALRFTFGERGSPGGGRRSKRLGTLGSAHPSGSSSSSSSPSSSRPSSR